MENASKTLQFCEICGEGGHAPRNRPFRPIFVTGWPITESQPRPSFLIPGSNGMHEKRKLTFSSTSNKKCSATLSVRQKHLNMSDNWLCFSRGIIFTIKQNDCVKDKNVSLKPVPGDQIVSSVNIKIVTVEFPPPPKKKKVVQETWPLKNPAVAVDVKKIPAGWKSSTPPHPTFLMVRP